GQGRTLIFVSHNLSAVKQMCNRVILLNSGRIEIDGPTEAALGIYNDASGFVETSERVWKGNLPGTDVVRLQSARVITEEGEVSGHLDIRKPIGIQMNYEVHVPGFSLVPVVHIYGAAGNRLFVSHDTESARRSD